MMFFGLLIAMIVGGAQYVLWRTKQHGLVKYSPIGLSLAVFVVCWMRIFGWISLPLTFYISKPSFFQFPDFVYVMLGALARIFGAVLGIAAACTNKKH